MIATVSLSQHHRMPATCERLLAHPARLQPESAASLQQLIAQADGVDARHVLLSCGGDPVQSAILPALIRQRLLRNPRLLFRQLIAGDAFPVWRTRCSWYREQHSPTAHMLDVGPDSGFQLRPEQIRAALSGGPGVIHLLHPDNPTGNALITPEALAPELAAAPDSIFWIDESCVHYAPEDSSFAALIPHHPNLIISRSFSYAWGLAASRIGYTLGAPEVLAPHRDAFFTRIDGFSAGLCAAALRDTSHLPRLRWEQQTERAWFHAGLSRHGIEVFPSISNLLLCRFRDGRPAAALLARMKADPLTAPEAARLRLPAEQSDAPGAWFRVSIGRPDENRALLGAIDDCL